MNPQRILVKVTLIVITLLGFSSHLFSAPTLILKENQRAYPLGLHLDLLVDEAFLKFQEGWLQSE